MVMRECSQCIWAVRGDQRSQGHGCSFTAVGLNNLGFPRCQGQSWNFLNISFSNSHVDSVRCSFSNRFQPEAAVSLCFISLAAVLDHLQIMGHTSKELQLFCSQRLQQHPKRRLDQLLIWPAQNLPWVSSKCFLDLQVPFCQRDGSRMCGWRWGVISVPVPWWLSADGSSPGRFQWVQALFTTGKWRWNNI